MYICNGNLIATLNIAILPVFLLFLKNNSANEHLYYLDILNFKLQATNSFYLRLDLPRVYMLDQCLFLMNARPHKISLTSQRFDTPVLVSSLGVI